MRRLLVLSIVAASVTVGATTASAATWIRQAPVHAGKHTLVVRAHGKAAQSATWIRAAKLGRATWIR
jgi:hypothetical protein